MSDQVPATQQGGALAVFDYGDTRGAGFEQITTADLSLAFLSILQALSPQVGNDAAKKVPGAVAGQLFNTVTRQCFNADIDRNSANAGPGIVFQPVGVNHTYVEWKPRTQGGGFVGTYAPTDDVVTAAKADQQANRPKEFGKYKTVAGNDLVETYVLFGLAHDNDNLDEQAKLGVGTPMFISFKSTQIKPLRNLLSRLYTFVGRPPIFAHRIRINTVGETRSKGTSYNFKLTAAVNDDIQSSLIPPRLGDAAHPLLVAGMRLAESFTKGAVKVNYSATAHTEGENGEGAPKEDDIPF